MEDSGGIPGQDVPSGGVRDGDPLWVIIRSTGEYSDRMETAIRYAWSEVEAQAAVDRAATESQTMRRPPWPAAESSHGVLMPDGSWWEGYILNKPADGKWCRKPNGDELEAAAAEARAAYYRQCLEMGCVDPTGPDPDASYYCEQVLPLPDTAERQPQIPGGHK